MLKLSMTFLNCTYLLIYFASNFKLIIFLCMYSFVYLRCQKMVCVCSFIIRRRNNIQNVPANFIREKSKTVIF